MSQIPNIEETHNTREIEEIDYDLALNTLIDSLHAFHKDCLEFPYDNDPIARRARKVVYAKDIIKPFIATIQSIKQTLHQQLQKARQDWLREEIVKLEGMKTADYPSSLADPVGFTKCLSKNNTLQSIIDCYLLELNEKEV